MDSSSSTYRVGKVQSIFSLPVNKSDSVIPLFRCSVTPYSAFYRLPFLDRGLEKKEPRSAKKKIGHSFFSTIKIQLSSHLT